MDEPTIQQLIEKLEELINDPRQTEENRMCYQGQIQWLCGCREWLKRNS